MTISASGLTYDQVVVDSGGQITVAATITSTLANGAGTDLTINGTWLNSGGTWTTTGTWTVGVGGTFIHNTTSGIATPLGQATFDAASNFIYRGSSTLTPALSTANRTYGNLSFESTSGSWTAAASGGTPLTVNGNFSIGAGVTYSTTQTGVMTFAGNFTNNGTLINSTGTQIYTFTGSGKTISGSGAISFETLNVNTGASVTANSPVTLASTFIGTIDGTLATGATFTNSGTMNVNGSFQLNLGGFAQTNNFVYGASSTLVFNNSSGSYGVSGTPAYWPAASGPPNVTVQGAGGITMSVARTVSGVFQYAAGVSGANNLTLNGTIQVNAGGFVSGSPTYGSSSLLRYNTGGTYGRNGEWLPSATSGAGYPNLVQISNNTTLELGNGSTGTPFQLAGSLTIDNGSTMQLAGGFPLTQPLTVVGSLVISGALTLSTASGGDIKVGGNWTRAAAGTFTSNGRAVFFNGTGTQTVAVTGGGTETFSYLLVDKPSGNLTLSSSPATTVSVSATVGDVLQLLNVGGIDLGGQSLTMANAGGNFLVGGSAAGTRTVTGTGTFVFSGSKTVTNNNGKTLLFDTNVTVNMNAAVDFGASLTTINGTLQVLGGTVAGSNPPTYANGSTLKYSVAYNVFDEWKNGTSGPGVPFNVQCANGTVDFNPNATSTSRTARGSVTLNGTAGLTLGTSPGGDLNVGIDWINNGGTFTNNNRTVTFNGTVNQSIGGTASTTFGFLTINNTGAVNNNTVTLARNTIVSSGLTVSAGIFDQGTGASSSNLTTNAVTVSSGATFQNLGVGDLTLSGNVANSGTITFNGNGTPCGEADDILIRSSLTGTQRTWSGAGTFSMTDVNVQDQRTPVAPPPVAIVVTSGTDSGNNTGWSFTGVCTAGTYTWVGGVNADWQVPTNWSPTRTVPAAGDVLVFDGNATPGPIVTNVPTQTIAALRLINSVAVTLNASAVAPPQTLTLSGATGTDLSVPALSSLTLASANALRLAIASGSTGVVGGLMIFQDGAHRLIGNAANAATFQSGAIFTTASGFTGNAFGTGTAGSIIFANLSNYFHNAGASPFGVSPNPAVVVFQTGSKANFLTATGFEASGRTYADLAIGKVDPGGIAVTASDGGSGDFTFDNLSINSPSGSNSSLTFTGSGASTVTVKGNITSNGAGLGTVQDVTLAGGSGGIVIDKTGGTITFGNDGSNSRAIDFESSASVTSGTTLALARKLLVSISQPSSFVLTVNGSLTGGATGYVIGKVKRPVTGTELFIYHVGTVNGYSPLDANFTAGTGDLTVVARQGAQPVLNSATSLQRYWNLTEGGAITADLTFHYNDPPDVMGNEANYRLIVVEAGNATSFPEVCPAGPCVAEGADTIKQTGVVTFSDWTAGEPNAPTAVNLTGFTAARYKDEVTLQWQSGYEARNLGYNIYREQNGQRTRVTPSLVAGSALVAGRQTEMTAGRSYTWHDQIEKAVGRGQKTEIRGQRSEVSYWLEDVDLDGTRRMHGPVAPVNVYSVPPGGKELRSDMIGEVSRRSAATGVQFDGWPASFAQQQTRIIRPPFADPDRTALQRDIESRPGVKIAIKKSGYYRITQPELIAAGIDPNTNWPQLQLYANGRAVPIKQSGDEVHLTPSDYIEFYAHGLESPTDAAQTYYLVVADQFGTRISDLIYRNPQPLPPPSGPTSFDYTVERKERMIYFSGLLNGDVENFFGQIVSTSPASSTMPVGGSSAGTPAQLAIALQGVTNQSHLVQVRFNGVAVGIMNFNNTGHEDATFDIPAGAVLDGNNTVELTSLGGAADVSLVDVMRLIYARSYVADNDRLSFSVDTAETKRVAGFTTSNLRVLDITDTDQVVDITPTVVVNPETGGTWSVDMQVQEASLRQVHTLMVFADAQPTGPDLVKHNYPSSWWSQTAGADYVIITSSDLKASVEPLAQLRRNQGLVVQVIDVEDLYDEFSYGQHSPLAIQGFLQLTMDSWTRKPHYVLLAGDASYDPKNYFGQGENDLVPTKLIDISLMETASDDWLADFNGDGLADMAVGRLPVRSAADMNLLVAKIIGYENTAPDPSRGALLVADSSFEAMSSSVESLLPAGLPVQSINRSGGNDAATHSQIVASINQGPRVANYFGHGSNGVWTSASLLSSTDAPGFTNSNRLSVFTMMTCFNGYFHDAYNESLSEALLKSQGGAVAVWASDQHD